MNNLMTKSFLDYVELKKQVLKDSAIDSEPDLESGNATHLNLTHAEEENLSDFFIEVEAIQLEMESISNLLQDLHHLNEESKSTHSTKLLRGLRDQMDSDVASILHKANIIKARLAALDNSNAASQNGSPSFCEGSSVDRTGTSVTRGLRAKLREMMNGFQLLREQIVAEHREGLKRKYFNATGDEATEEVIEEMVLKGSRVMSGVLGEKVEEMEEREKAVREIQRSLTRLHQVFLDMAVVVEKQEEGLNDIEENVANAKEFISGGTGRLVEAEALRKRKKRRFMGWWLCLLVVVVLVLLIFGFSD